MTDATNDLGRVAIIGMAGRFPRAGDIDAFWENLRAGTECISHLSEEELVAAGVSPSLLKRPNYVKSKGVLEGGDLFDASFFGISPREAEIMDPQHRVFLECAWEALETAGYDPQTFGGRIGVFAGASLNTYLLFNLMANRGAVDAIGTYQTMIANDKDFIPTRASYKLGLKGPSITVQTACSTSLVAVHLACQSLLAGECDIALAGGVSVTVPLKNGYLHEKGGILSPDGHCRAFDAGAGGTVTGNGVALVVLRRLADAREHGDVVDAVIRGSAINNDGSLKVGYTAPSVEGQAEVIAEALGMADVDPESVGYVETHGTGTALGDPIEIAALTRAFRERTQKLNFCAIGSVKSNVGHLDAAAGATALIKATLALKHQAIPGSLHFERPNPETGLETSPFFVNSAYRPWERNGTPRRAGVSSFGIGGTNAHVVLEEGPARERGGPSRPWHLLPISARSAPALAESAERLARHLEKHPEADLADVAFTLAARRPFELRRAIVCADRAGAIDRLRRDARAAPPRPAARAAPVAFLFPGQGAQYPDMARGLYEQEPTFRAELDRCLDLFAEHLDGDLRADLFPAAGDEARAAERLAQTARTQPALFAVEYALARTWMAWGVRPRAMIGHSIGEWVAACLAGVFSLEDAVSLVAARGRLVQSMPRGAMLAVFLPEAQVRPWLDDRLCLAAVNSSSLSVVSGPSEAVEALERRLTDGGQTSRRLHTSHAFHSPMMEPAVRPFIEEVRKVRLEKPRVPFLSNVTGTWIEDGQATSPEYWGAHLRDTVRFADGLSALLDDPALLLLEVGPGQNLGTFARQHAAWNAERVAISSMRHPNEERADLDFLLGSLGALWSAGGAVDWSAFYGGEERRRVRLPTYPFQRQRFWVKPVAEKNAEASAIAEGKAEELGDWIYGPSWRRLPPLRAEPKASTWLVLGADAPLGRELARRFEAAGDVVVRVVAGDAFAEAGERSFSLAAGRREHYVELLAALNDRGIHPSRVVHLWSLEREPGERLGLAQLEEAQPWGFDSLIALAQALGERKGGAPIAVDVLCRGVFSVTGEERLQPENATLLGPCTVMPQELTGVSCRVLDVTGSHLRAPGGALVEAVREALLAPAGDRAIAWRGNHWWARSFDAIHLDGEEQGASRLRPGGVYLITGGLGGIGLALGEHLARSVRGPVLALVGRSPFPAEEAWQEWLASHGEGDATSARIRKLQELRSLGARPVVLQADVADLAQTTSALEELRRRFGAIHGVIHAAGLPARGLMVGKSREEVAQVMAAKTKGTLVLDAACSGDSLDFFVLCSSRTSILGGPGQADYCGANAFQDAFAQWKRSAQGSPVMAIAWDTWRDTGMAAGSSARLGAGAGTRSGEEIGHPLLQRRVEKTDTSEVFLTTLSTADSWIVDEHRMMGHGLVPGTTYLEMMRAAVAPHAAGKEIEFRDVLFMLPVIVPDGQTRDLYTTLEKRDGALRFRIRSRNPGDAPGWQEHATGTVLLHEREERPVRAVADLLEACRVEEVIETEAALRRRLRLDFAAEGGIIRFAVRGRWRCLTRIHAGSQGLVAVLELPEEYAPDLETFLLHPALLDVVGGASRVRAQEGYYLPFWYRSLRFVHGFTRRMSCHIRIKEGGDSTGETLTCDVDVFDEAGRLLVQIGDFVMKRIHEPESMRDQIERASAPPEAPSSTAAGAPSGIALLRAMHEGMSAEEGTEVFRRVLAEERLPAQVIVSTKDLSAMRRLAESIDPSRLATEMEQMGGPTAVHPRPELSTPYVAPESEVEKAVAAIWQEVLGIEPIGVHDDFFALGGHSLAAVQIGSKLRSRFGVDLALRDFFERPTVANTVQVMTASGGGKPQPQDERIERLSREEPGAEPTSVEAMSDDEVDAMLSQMLATEAVRGGEKA